MSRHDEARYGRACLLVLNVCPFTLRHVIDDYSIRHGSLSLVDFLEKKKHLLFHLVTKNCCCRSQTSRATPMYKSQWESLFMKNRSPCPRNVSFDCPCQYNAKPGITTNVMDITMCCLVINNICPGVNLSDITTIREIRNKLIHANSGNLDLLTFSDYWIKIELALLNLASNLSRAVHTHTLYLIDELKNRMMDPSELEELRKLVIEEQRITDLEEDVSTMKANLDQTKLKLDETTDKVTNISMNVNETADIVTKISTKVTQVEDKLTQNVHQTHADILRMKTAIVKQGQETKGKFHEQYKPIQEKIDEHEIHIKENERQIGVTYKKICEHDKKIYDHSKHIDEHCRQINEQGGQINELGRQIDEYGRQISEHSREISIQKIGYEKRPGLKSDIKELKQMLLDINTDKTKLIELSPLQERGYNELPIELIYASLVIRRDVDIPSRSRSKLDSFKDFFKRVPGQATEQRDISEVTDPADIFQIQGKIASDVYMLGDAAHGKTTYCLWILKKWYDACLGKLWLDKWERAIKEFDFVFLIQFRHINPDRASVIDMLCQDVFKRNKGCHDTIRHVLSSERYRSLIIMDGLDEWNPSEETRKQLTCQGMPNIEDVSSSVSCFFTMRPWVFPIISKNTKARDKVIQIKGLNEDGMMNVIKNVLTNHYKLKLNSSEFKYTYDKIAKYLKKTNLKSFMKIPLLAVVCVQIWYEDKQVGDSMTSFYAEMLNMLIERENQKHKIRVKDAATMDYNVPKMLSNKPQIKKHFCILSKLGKLAHEGLLFNKTNLEFPKEELEEKLSPEELKFALNVGLISQKDGSSLTTKKVSVHFFHKSIQEFLAAIYIVTCNEEGDAFSKHLSTIKVIMELSNVIMFICGMCPALGSVISQRIVRVTDRDTDIAEYRHSTKEGNKTVVELYKLQLIWYRELQRIRMDRQVTDNLETLSPMTDDRLTFHLSDVYISKAIIDRETVRITREILCDQHVYIRTLFLWMVPTDGEYGISNKELNEFLCNKHENLSSLIMVCINSRFTDRSIHQICIPSLRFLCIKNNTRHGANVCPLLLSGVKLLRTLMLENVTLGDNELDLSDMTSLQMLRLSCVTLGDRGLDLSGLTSLRTLLLTRVTLGDRGLNLTSNMVHIEKVSLCSVKMSAAQWQRYILSVQNMQHTLNVELLGTNIDDESKTMLRSSPDFNITMEGVTLNGSYCFNFTRRSALKTRYAEYDT